MLDALVKSTIFLFHLVEMPFTWNKFMHRCIFANYYKVTGSYWEIWANNPYVNSFLEFETEKPFQTKEGKCSIRATSL